MEISSADGRRSLTVTVPTFNTMGHATKETLDTVGHATKETLDTVGHATKETLDTVGQATGRATGGAAKVAMKPIEMARRVLPAKGGLPLYVGLGALGAVEVIEWPVAIGIGVGYAVLRKGGMMAQPEKGTEGRTAGRAKSGRSGRRSQTRGSAKAAT
ncbi:MULTISPECIES: hypothetical protein [Streptomyces]|uniref:Uncharacterized protein n=3 Tax=Streptomyces TaxID=1883 RepID=A0A2J7YSP2_STRMQ|nr:MULTISPECIES: hypothetical protein [Streptomyces]AUA09412.1 hypothetical protein CFP59_01502 [Streptomyces sp. M56]MCC4314444.1 hypothetical protein [Streptomyces malaysiensis]MCD9594130.1 hypothetical protein [Streptomyces sp. 8ZJF_21]PNG91053.1 hypothetical protein SMF913_26518 [Streptomyces malaysiensis]QPI60199.1 hypothetical protein I1A49_39625 [Streptomyces solisilvae]